MGRGRKILPPMPIPMYKNFTDEDLAAIFTYLQSIRYFERGHAGQGIDRRARERVERAEPPICRRPQHALHPCRAANISATAPMWPITVGIARSRSCLCVSTRTRILVSRPNAISTTAVVWIAMVSTMSERPKLQLARSTRFPYHRPPRQTATTTEVDRGGAGAGVEGPAGVG